MNSCSADPELSFEERAKLQKSKEARRKKARTERHREQFVGKLVESDKTPTAATALARALQEWLKFMLGVPRRTKDTEADLPDAPTEDEKKTWIERGENRQALLKKAIDSAVRKYIKKQMKKVPNFTPNAAQTKAVETEAAEEFMMTGPMNPVKFTSRLSVISLPKYSHLWGTQCEAALALAGFPRCTFDWLAVSHSPWNTSMLSILIQGWVKCFDGGGVKGFGVNREENTPGNRELIVQRWVENQRGKYRLQRRQNEMKKTTEGFQQVMEDVAISRSRNSRRKALSKVGFHSFSCFFFFSFLFSLFFFFFLLLLSFCFLFSSFLSCVALFW